jgi:ADP-heptose:LPS heptosyltransferase
MQNRSEHNQVYVVRSLEEVRRTLLSAEKVGIKTALLRAFVAVWVFMANCSLHALKFLLFKRDYFKEEFKSIVAYTDGILGDNVIMLPSLAALKKKYHDSSITVIANLGPYPTSPSEIFRAVSYVDNLVVLDDHPVRRRGWRLILDPKVEGVSCNLFVNLAPYGNRGWFKAVVREMIFAKWIGAKYAVGFRVATKRYKGVFNQIQHHFVENEPNRPKRVLRELGLTPVENVDLLPVSVIAKEAVLTKLRAKAGKINSYFIINPGANLGVKQWPASRFGLVAYWIAKQFHAHPVVTGTIAEKEIAEEVVGKSSGLAINMAGETSVQELIELLRLAKGCVTNDTGTMHLAAMIGLPAVAIFGARIPPTWWFPNGNKVISIFSFAKCRYCYNDNCETNACLKDIEVDHVIRALKEVMSA